MKTITATLLALTALVATGCYMEAEEDLSTDSAALETVTEGDTAESQMSHDGEALESDEVGFDLCPTAGQRCSTNNDCTGLELCMGSRCRCECDYGAYCGFPGADCGFAGFCGANNYCNCY